MSLFICRHGRTAANKSGLLLGRANPDLDRLGRAQAQAMADSLPSVTTVVSSPLARCHQTAEAFGKPVRTDERLLELDYGEMDLKPLSEVPPEIWAQWRSDSDFRPPGGETLNELYARVSTVLTELADEAAETDVVVMTHVSPIKASVAWALGCPMEISWRCFVAQASVTKIAAVGGRPSLQLFNGVHHLEMVEEDPNGD